MTTTSARAAPRFDGTELSYNQTLDALCSFIKVATHTILCHRALYPPNVFTRRQRYRIPVWASRHPGLTEYVDEVVRAVRVQLDRRAVQSVHLVITSRRDATVLERYRFDVDFLIPPVQPRDKDLAIPGNLSMPALELHLRSFMQKLVSVDGALEELDKPEDATWALVLDMVPGSVPETADTTGNEPAEGPWVPFEDPTEDWPATTPSDATAADLPQAAPAATTGAATSSSSSATPEYLRARRRAAAVEAVDEELGAPMILPVKSLDTGVINLMLYVEEHPESKRNHASDPVNPDAARSTCARREADAPDASAPHSVPRDGGAAGRTTGRARDGGAGVTGRGAGEATMTTKRRTASAMLSQQQQQVQDVADAGLGEPDLDEHHGTRRPRTRGGRGAARAKRGRSGAGGAEGDAKGKQRQRRDDDDDDARVAGVEDEGSEAGTTERSRSDDDEMASSRSDGSGRSVGDFAGFAGGGGGAGMAGTRM